MRKLWAVGVWTVDSEERGIYSQWREYERTENSDWAAVEEKRDWGHILGDPGIPRGPEHDCGAEEIGVGRRGSGEGKGGTNTARARATRVCAGGGGRFVVGGRPTGGNCGIEIGEKDPVEPGPFVFVLLVWESRGGIGRRPVTLPIWMELPAAGIYPDSGSRLGLLQIGAHDLNDVFSGFFRRT